LLRLTPGDLARSFGGDAANPCALERIRDSLGLERPAAWLQFFGTWRGQLLRGDLGNIVACANTSVGWDDRRPSGPTLNIRADDDCDLSVAWPCLWAVIAVYMAHRVLVDFLVMSFSWLGFSVRVL